MSANSNPPVLNILLLVIGCVTLLILALLFYIFSVQGNQSSESSSPAEMYQTCIEAVRNKKNKPAGGPAREWFDTIGNGVCQEMKQDCEINSQSAACIEAIKMVEIMARSN